MLQPSVLGAGGTLLFFGCVAAVFVPFAMGCLPETKGLSLENVLPMFTFEGWAGFRTFVRGNRKHGGGVRPPGDWQSDVDMVELAPLASAGAVARS